MAEPPPWVQDRIGGVCRQSQAKAGWPGVAAVAAKRERAEWGARMEGEAPAAEIGEGMDSPLV